MSVGLTRGDKKQRALLARTALPTLMLLFAPLFGCDMGSYAAVPTDGASGGSSGGQAGTAGASSAPVLLVPGLGGSISLTPPKPPCQLPDASSPVFAARVVSSYAPARRELFTWTTPEQAQELRAGSVLLTRTEREGLGPGYAMQQLASIAQEPVVSSDANANVTALAALLSGPRFNKARYAWSEPWATRAGWPGETYGDQLVRILLREEAWLARYTRETFDVIDMNNQPIAIEDALAHPERLAGIYFVRDAATGGPRCDGSFRGGDNGYREFIIGNERMVEEWSLGTPEIRARLEGDLALVQEFFQRVRPCPDATDAHNWNIDVVCGWQFDPTSTALSNETLAFANALAMPSAGYLPQPAALAQLMELLQSSLFEPEPFVVKPEP